MYPILTNHWLQTGESNFSRARNLLRKGLFIFPLIGLLAAANQAFSAEASLPEHQVKALFLLNFTKYVEWPAEAFTDPGSPIVIAVLGESKVTQELQKAIAGRNANGRPIVLKHLASGEDPGVCHILFITAAEQQHASAILSKLGHTSVLTVGESNDFLDSGGIINLARRDQKVALEVDLNAARNSGITISSKLLSVVALVKGKAK
jgi:uncharacterized protein DUF4154